MVIQEMDLSFFFFFVLKIQEAVAFVMAQNRRSLSSKFFVSGDNQRSKLKKMLVFEYASA